MAASTATALAQRRAAQISSMPPPPIKRIKRPATVLDEDDYTAALSEIIARDYFPGLLESKAQQEYLAALESNDDGWIEEAGKKLVQASTPLPSGARSRGARNRGSNTAFATPLRQTSAGGAGDTPRRWTGEETPSRTPTTTIADVEAPKPSLDTSSLSLAAFQAKYTSEDNESFNAILDRQNQKRREKHAYIWTEEQRIPSARQIGYRAREAKLLAQKASDEADGKSLVPMTTGATDSRPAKPDSWRQKSGHNTFMFHASSVDEEGLPTVAASREASSKAAPKSVAHSNTRFPTQHTMEDPAGPVPPSPSLNTSIIARRDAARATAAAAPDYEGGETPRVNGYAYVDEDEDEPDLVTAPIESLPSYRDLLAGQVGDATPNPFKIHRTQKREDLHFRMVEKTAQRKRVKEAETRKTDTSNTAKNNRGNMTPAAKKLMDRIGRTPLRDRSTKGDKVDWTPGVTVTPRRRRG